MQDKMGYCPILKVAPKYFFSETFSEKCFRQKLFGSKGDIRGYH